MDDGIKSIQDDLVPVSWKTLFLPKNFPRCQATWNYVFGHNETHKALPLDYGSVINHHESANTIAFTRAIGFNDNYNFQVRRGFQCGNHSVLKKCAACMYAFTCIP